MAEMKGGGCSGFQRLLNWIVGSPLSFWTSRDYIGMRFRGFFLFFYVLKFSKATEKSFLDVRHNFGGKILI